MRKKILYVWQSSYPHEIRIEKIQSSIQKIGTFSLICKNFLSEKNLFSKIDSIHQVNSPPLPFSPIWTTLITKAIKEDKIDLLIARDILIAPSSILAAKKSNIPVILDMAENYPEAMRGWKKYNQSILKRWIVHKLKIPDRIESWSVKHADLIWVVCDEQKNRLLKANPCLPRNKIQIVSNTPSQEFIASTQSMRLSSNAIKFGYHGAVTPERGLRQFILGFKQAQLKNADIEFHIFGRGESLQDLENEFSNSVQNVFFHGGFNPNQYLELLGQIDVGVIPHLQNEFINTTIPNKIFEYMISGKPVLTSLAAPLTRIVQQYQCGLSMNIEDPNSIQDAILNLTNSPILQWAQNGRNAVLQSLNWAEEEKTIYQSLSL